MKKTIVFTALPTILVVVLIFGTVQYILGGSWKPRPEGAPTPAPEGAEWINLLSDENRPNWRNITDDSDIFTFEGDSLHIYGKSVKLKYAGYAGHPFSDFDLHLEFKVAKRTNSGVFLRVQENDPVHRGFEVQVLDDHGRPPNVNGSGALYDVVSPMFNMARPSGEWNSYDITVRGTEIVVRMNGWKVIDTDFAQMTQPIGKFSLPFAELPREGLIALQDHGGSVWYRNIYVRPLNESQNAAIVPQHEQ